MFNSRFSVNAEVILSTLLLKYATRSRNDARLPIEPRKVQAKNALTHELFPNFDYITDLLP